MGCADAEKVAGLLESGGSADEERWLEDHLQSCDLCQAELESALDEFRAGPVLGSADRTADTFLFRELDRRLQETFATGPAAGRSDPFAGLVFDAPRTAEFLGRLGPYDLIEELGRGGFGVVYLARDAEVNRYFAIKVLRPDLADDPAFLELFFAEARKANEVDHPYVVPVVRAGRPPEFRHACVVMEFVHGRSLRDTTADWTADQRRRSVRASARMIQQLAEGLQAIHEKGMIHRDVKTANILLDEQTGWPRLTDFGLAQKVIGPEAAVAGDWGGTLPYMSPEQIRFGRTDARSDVYSLGVVLYELLAGERPFRGVPQAVRRQILDEPPVPPRQRNDAVPRDLETIALTCLAKDPDRRYPTAVALAEDLRRFLAGLPIQARPVSRPERVWLWCRRNRALAAFLAVAVLAPVAVAGVLFVAWRHEQTLRWEADRQRQLVEASYRQRLASLEFVADQLIAEIPVSGVSQEVRVRLERNFLNHFREELAQHHERSGIYFGDACAMYAYYARAFAQLDEARRYYEQALAAYESAGSTDGRTRLNEVRYHVNLGTLCYDLGRQAEAYGHLDRAQALCEAGLRAAPDRELAEMLAHLFRERGSLRRRDDAWQQALDDYAAAETQLQRLLEASPQDTQLLFDLSCLKRNAGNVWDDWAKRASVESHWTKAEAAYAEAVRIGRRATAGTTDRTMLNELAEHYNALAVTAKRLGHLDQALQAYGQSVQIRRKLVTQHPGDVPSLEGLGRTLNNLALLHLTRGELPQSRALFEDTIQLREGLIRLRPDYPEYKRNLVNTLLLASDLALAEKNPDQARALVDRGVQWAQQAAEQAPAVIAMARMLSTALQNQAQVLRTRSEDEAAVESYQQAIGVQHRILSLPECTSRDQADLAALYHESADTLADLRRREEAVAAYETAAGEWKRSDQPGDWQRAARCYCGCADLCAAPDDAARRRRYVEEAIAALEEAVSRGFRDFQALEDSAFDAIRDEPAFRELNRLAPRQEPR